ncbi:KilA-N domain-containing protein [Veillonella sp. VA139]|uniref:KilA-N domain-containing protein n=1 Tax=Veillonella sp. VA139 TaxID=741830 RepID=UPI000F8C95DC|nr:KilA-N domain-containing protein [Veillonella sp. VA139]
MTNSPQKWATTTNAKGLFVKVGRAGGTFAHKDIAFKFTSWIYFEEIIFKSKMFDMDVDTTFKIRGERLGIG